MRSFIAVEMKNEKIFEVLREFKKVKADVKIVEPENLHTTLKFLGEIQENLIDEIHKASLKAFENFEKFEVSLRGLGGFPNTNYMRVVWIGFEKNRQKIIEMQQALDRNLIKLNFKPEARAFEPHLTIGRVKSQRGKDELKRFILQQKDNDFGCVAIEKVEFKKSVLTPKGPVYSTVRVVELK